MKLRTFLLPALLAASAALPAGAQISAGSPAVDRAINDSSSGLICLYRGPSQPIQGPGELTAWSFFDNEQGTSGARVTPLLLEIVGGQNWKVVGFGTPRSSNASGLQSHPFQLLAGTATLLPGKAYTMGFVHRDFALGAGGTLVPGAGYSGVVDFDGYNLTTDTWSYAIGMPELGGLIGNDGLSMDGFGFTGRIYSANFTVRGIATLPGCSPNSSTLGLDVANLEPGTAFTAQLTANGFSAGLWQLYLGTPFANGAGCGLPVPGLGELLLLPGSQVSLGSGSLVAGQGQMSLGVPNSSALVGLVFLLQGLTAGVFTPGVPIELSNGLAAQILP